MSAVPSIALFHQWLLAAAPDSPPACSIVLHGTPPSLSLRLWSDIAAYLNEYDDAGDGRWLALQPELVPLIAEDPRHRHLLGLKEEAAPNPHSQPFGVQRALTALAIRGHLVLDSPLAAAATRGLKNIFHVGIGLPPDGLTECHIILNPGLFQITCLPQIVGDVFLEWLNAHDRKLDQLHGL